MKSWIFVIAIFGISALAILTLGNKSDVQMSAYATGLEGRTGGQKHNAELALRKLNGTVIGPHQTFSFNKKVGTWSRDAGYRRAPVSYNGTLIESWGGGVCQTSSTLYNAAMLAGMDLVERSSHRFRPDYVPPGRDAAVAFDGIDLKFRNPYDFAVKIHGEIDGDQLIIRFSGQHPPDPKPEFQTVVHEVLAPKVYRVSWDGGTKNIRNEGKKGWEVSTYRITGGQRELLSVDSYPAMNKVIPEM